MKRLCAIWCFCVSRQLYDSSVVWFMYVKEEREREKWGNYVVKILCWVGCFVLLCILCANASCSSTKIRSLRIMFTGN